MARRCARPDCHGPASSTLSYDYVESTVWLDHLDDEPHPMSHDLCDSHADGLRVPRGWQLRDRRPPVDAALLDRSALAS